MCPSDSEHGLGSQAARAGTLALPFPECVILGKYLTSVLPFAHVPNKDTHLINQ